MKREISRKIKRIRIAVMVFRVNGPGETERADLGLVVRSCEVNLKKGRGGPRRVPLCEFCLIIEKRELDA